MKSAAKLQKIIDIFGIFENYLYFCTRNFIIFNKMAVELKQITTKSGLYRFVKFGNDGNDTYLILDSKNKAAEAIEALIGR